MGSSKISGDHPIRWIVSRNLVCIEQCDEVYHPCAADIVRVEFKGQSLINGIAIDEKPSVNLPLLHFNRFPCSLKLELKIPSNTFQRPILELVAVSSSKSHSIQNIPESDQILVGGKDWYPLFPDNVQEIKDLMEATAITKLGIVTLRQSLDLIKSNSPLVSTSSDLSESTDLESVQYDYKQLVGLITEYGFRANLYPYQKNGISWLRSISDEKLGCVLADEMGLGKTLQVIAVLSYYTIKWKMPSLVIAPATLLENWRREYAHFSPKSVVYVHSGSERTGFPSQLRNYNIVICSYDTAVRDQGLLGMLEWGFVVLDEAQAIKNPETRRAIAVKGLKRKVSIAVTGTPVENQLMDLWSIMDFTCTGLLGTREDFERNFSNDNQSAEELEALVSPLMLRRRVADVATDLPEKIIISQPVNMSDNEVRDYELLRQQVVDEYGKSANFVSLLRLRQYCTHPLIVQSNSTMSTSSVLGSSKYCRLLEILEEIFSNNEKVIVFTSFTVMSDIFGKDIQIRFNMPFWKIDGRTPVEERQDIVDMFSEVAGAAILVLNPKAAGTGLNITAANHVIHYTLEWNPAVEDQATARAHRRGQTLPVIVHRLFYPSTVEEIINDRLNRKRQLAETAVVGTESSVLDVADITNAIKMSPVRNK